MYNDNNPTYIANIPVAPYRFSNSVCINTNGAILFGGYENATYTAGTPATLATTVSVVGQVVGNTGGAVYTQVPRFPLTSTNGTLGTPINLQSSAGLANGHPQAIYTFDSGTFSGFTLLATTNGTDTTLVMLDATTYALNTTTGATSFGSNTGVITLTGFTTITKIMVDTVGNIYVMGVNSSGVAVYKVNTAGTTATLLNLPTATTIDGLTSAYDIVQQATGRILIAGYNSLHASTASGVIMSYDPVHNMVDASFNSSGTPGYWYNGVAHPMMSIAVGATSNAEHDADRIFFVYMDNSSNAVIKCLLKNGTQLAPDFTFGTAVISVTADTQLVMQLDVNGKIVLVANSSTGIQAARYTATGADDVSPAVIIPNSYGSSLKDLITLSDGTTLILASNRATLDLACLNSDFAPDSTFNAGGSTIGLLSTAVATSPAQAEFFAVDVVAGAAGILITSDTNLTATSAIPYLTTVINSATVTKVNQGASQVGTAGQLDTTCNAVGRNPGFINLNSDIVSYGFPSGMVAALLLQNRDGSYYIAGSDAINNSYITLMSDDDIQQTSFGTSGLLTLSQGFVTDMLLAENGGFYVVGGAGPVQGWIFYLNGSTGALMSGFAPTQHLTAHYSIAQQPEGRIIVAGILDRVGTLIAYNPTTGALDTTFGVEGYYTLTGYGAINSVVVDLVNNIYVIANDASHNATVICINPDGTEILWSRIVTANSTQSILNHLTFNQTVNLVAVAVNESAYVIQLNSYTLGALGGTAINELGLSSSSTNLTHPQVTSVSVDLNTSPGKIILTGYDDGVAPIVPFIIRTNTNELSLDSSFSSGSGTPGVVTTITPGGFNAAWYDAIINADGKITVAGYDSLSGTTTPYVMRVYGDEFIGQYDPEVQEQEADSLNPAFGVNGIAYTGIISNLINGGDTVIDSQSRVILGGITSDNRLVAARFLSNGTLDTSFGVGVTGVTQTPVITSLTGNGFVAIDGSNNVYVGGYTSTRTLIVARFLASNGALDIVNFNASGSVPGVAQSPAILTLANGGWVTIDYLGNVLVGGSTVNEMLIVARFTSAGILDTANFNSLGITPGVAKTISIENLNIGSGSVATIAAVLSADNSIYVGGSTSDNTLVVAKFSNTGMIQSAYGTSGIAEIAISDLVAGSSIALDSNNKVVIGGYTDDNQFVVVRLTATGAADATFGTAGIAMSNSVSDLNSFADITIDDNNNVLVGGVSIAYDGVSRSMVVARFTTTGAIDTSFTTTGIATTGTIAGLVVGSFVATNGVINPFVGGFNGTQLVVAELYSGAEIFIANPAFLPPSVYNIYWYGNNPALFKNFLAVSFYALVITDLVAQADVIAQVNAELDTYAVVYQGQPNLNLLASTTPGWDAHFAMLQASLIATYQGSATTVEQINSFFTDFNARRIIVHNELAASSIA